MKKKRLSEPVFHRLDLGCGPHKLDGFEGVDIHPFTDVDHVCDLREKWPWKDGTVSEVYSSHFLEHLTGTERIHLFNELYRVLKVGGQARFITPDWSHDCAYGDPTHVFPPLSRWYPFYLQKAWRDVNAPHVPYTCDLDWVIAGSWDEWLNVRNMEFKTFAMQHYSNSIRDLIVTLTKRP